ncbi:hypothetical protein ABKN59_003997 [Abortiporus biennis]
MRISCSCQVGLFPEFDCSMTKRRSLIGSSSSPNIIRISKVNPPLILLLLKLQFNGGKSVIHYPTLLLSLSDSMSTASVT